MWKLRASKLIFLPCPRRFPYPTTSPSVADQLVNLLDYLRTMGEPYIGIPAEKPELFCKQFEAIECKLPLAAQKPSQRPSRCTNTTPPWHQEWHQRLTSLVNPPVVSSVASIRKLMWNSLGTPIKLQLSQVQTMVVFLGDQFRQLCSMVATAQKTLNEQDYARACHQYKIVMHIFKHLRAGLPKRIDQRILWRGNPRP